MSDRRFTSRALPRLGVKRNMLFSLAQSIFVTICLFLSYRQLIAYEGLVDLGLWSLVMVGASMGRVGDVSGAAALGRFLAHTDGELLTPSSRVELIHTVLLTSVAFNLVLAVPIALMVPAAVNLVLGGALMAETKSLIPFMISTMLASATALGVGSAIDGLHRADLRSILFTLGSCVALLFSLLLVPYLGLAGFASAQLIGQVFIVMAGWMILYRRVPGLGVIPSKWRWSVFRFTVGYGVKLNLVSLLVLFSEPVVKFSFGLVGGASQVGYYELASKTILQLRSFVVAAATPLIPAFARIPREETKKLEDMIVRVTKASSVGAVIVCLSALLAAPLVSITILGELSKTLILLSITLAVGWSLNTIAVPIYFAAQADGRMRWNVVSHLLQMFAVGLGLTVELWTGLPVLGVAVSLGLGMGAIVQLTGNSVLLDLRFSAIMTSIEFVAGVGLVFCVTTIAFLILF